MIPNPKPIIDYKHELEARILIQHAKMVENVLLIQEQMRQLSNPDSSDTTPADPQRVIEIGRLLQAEYRNLSMALFEAERRLTKAGFLGEDQCMHRNIYTEKEKLVSDADAFDCMLGPPDAEEEAVPEYKKSAKPDDASGEDDPFKACGIKDDCKTKKDKDCGGCN